MARYRSFFGASAAGTTTKLYLRNTQLNGLGATYYDLLDVAGSSADTAIVDTTVAGTEIQFTKTAGGSLVNFVSPPLAANVTLTTADVSLWFKESTDLANVGGRVRVFKYSGGSETELAGGPFDDGVEFTTSDAEYTWTANYTDTALAAGDRILVKVYIINIGVMAIGTATLTFNAADAATGDSFLLFGDALIFSAEAALSVPNSLIMVGHGT